MRVEDAAAAGDLHDAAWQASHELLDQLLQQLLGHALPMLPGVADVCGAHVPGLREPACDQRASFLRARCLSRVGPSSSGELCFLCSNSEYEMMELEASASTKLETGTAFRALAVGPIPTETKALPWPKDLLLPKDRNVCRCNVKTEGALSTRGHITVLSWDLEIQRTLPRKENAFALEVCPCQSPMFRGGQFFLALARVCNMRLRASASQFLQAEANRRWVPCFAFFPLGTATNWWTLMH